MDNICKHCGKSYLDGELCSCKEACMERIMSKFCFICNEPREGSQNFCHVCGSNLHDNNVSKASDLISELEGIVCEHGDIPVTLIVNKQKALYTKARKCGCVVLIDSRKC